MKEFESAIQIRPQNDAFDDVRMEYAQMLKNQLAKGNNGLIKTKYITFSIEAENIQKARPKLERIEADILNNFKALGVAAYPLMVKNDWKFCMRHLIQKVQFHFSLSMIKYIRQGLEQKILLHQPVSCSNQVNILGWEIELVQFPICRFSHQS